MITIISCNESVIDKFNGFEIPVEENSTVMNVEVTNESGKKRSNINENCFYVGQNS